VRTTDKNQKQKKTQPSGKSTKLWEISKARKRKCNTERANIQALRAQIKKEGDIEGPKKKMRQQDA